MKWIILAAVLGAVIVGVGLAMAVTVIIIGFEQGDL